MTVSRRIVEESLGQTGPPQRAGIRIRELSSEELGVKAATVAAQAVALLHRKVTRDLDSDEERNLALMMAELYDDWQLLDVLEEGQERVPVMPDASGELRVDWRR